MGAISARYAEALETSPPRDIPCAMRAASSRIGASQPAWSNVGSSAIAMDPPAISVMVSIIAFLRPRRSA